MYNTKTITIGEDTITNNTETNEVIRNDVKLHNYCIIQIDERSNIITRSGNKYKTVTPYETKLRIEEINAIREAYEEDEAEEPAKKITTKKTSKATVKGKQTQKKEEEKADDKK